MLSSYSREALKKVSTATLTTVLFKRGLRNVFIQGIFLLNKDSPRMVGEAFTLRYIPAREDVDQLAILFPVDDPVEVGWGVARNAPALAEQLHRFFDESKRIDSPLDVNWRRYHRVSLAYALNPYADVPLKLG